MSLPPTSLLTWLPDPMTLTLRRHAVSNSYQPSGTTALARRLSSEKVKTPRQVVYNRGDVNF